MFANMFAEHHGAEFKLTDKDIVLHVAAVQKRACENNDTWTYLYVASNRRQLLCFSNTKDNIWAPNYRLPVKGISR